jgi:hypothetical protein
MLIHTRLLARLVGVFLLLTGFNAAYALQEESITVTDTKIHVEKINSNAGQINFSVNLKKNTEYSIIFSNKKTIENTSNIIRFNTSDKGCSGEHQTSINYSESDEYYISKYFDKKIPWGEDHAISISWKDKTSFVFSQNDETISIKSIRKAKYIQIITNSSITLNNFSNIK